MKTFIITFVTLLIYGSSYGQVNGCFQYKQGRFYKSVLTLNKEGTYLHKFILKGDHLPLTSFERGTYTITGDSILFNVTAHGVEENKLQIGSLIRNGVLKRKAIILLAKQGDGHERLIKTKCRQQL